jgi:hypothetical protein
MPGWWWTRTIQPGQRLCQAAQPVQRDGAVEQRAGMGGLQGERGVEGGECFVQPVIAREQHGGLLRDLRIRGTQRRRPGQQGERRRDIAAPPAGPSQQMQRRGVVGLRGEQALAARGGLGRLPVAQRGASAGEQRRLRHGRVQRAGGEVCTIGATAVGAG